MGGSDGWEPPVTPRQDTRDVFKVDCESRGLASVPGPSMASFKLPIKWEVWVGGLDSDLNP